MKQQCYFSANNIQHIDYKDLELLKKSLNPHARIMKKERVGVCAKHQRALAQSIKHARFMGLLPFVAK